jgi:hypothetical protein
VKYDRMYRERWLDVSYKAGYLMQIVSAQSAFIDHLTRCAPDVCVHTEDGCATLAHLFDNIITALEYYEQYVTTGCPVETVTDAERKSEARSNQGASGTGGGDDAVREGDSDEWFGGVV